MRVGSISALLASAAVGNAAVLQASDATHLKNAFFRSSRSGYTGTGYIDFGSEPGVRDNGGEARWVYLAEHPGNYKVCTVHAGAMREAKLLVNSALLKEAKPVVMEPTGAWSNWVKTCVNVKLSQGTNKLTLQSDTGTAIVDKLTVQYNPIAEAKKETEGPTICTHTSCEMKNGMMMVRTVPHGTSQILYEGKGPQTDNHHCMYWEQTKSCRCYCHPDTAVKETAHNANIIADRALRPVDGQWAAWSDWSDCAPASFGVPSKTYRTRTCTNPAPVGTGKACAGADREEASCTQKTVTMGTR